MVMIKCPECGAEMPDYSLVCPNCGYPIQKDNNNGTPPVEVKPTSQKERMSSDGENRAGSNASSDKPSGMESSYPHSNVPQRPKSNIWSIVFYIAAGVWAIDYLISGPLNGETDMVSLVVALLHAVVGLLIDIRNSK